MPEKTPRDPQPAPHDLILESRARLTGAQLNMAALDLETGEAKFTGRIDTLEYTASAPAGGFLRRLLR